MSYSLLSNFWYELWNPIYEAVFGSIHAGNGWLNWGFWIAMIVTVILAVIYIIICWAPKPKVPDDAEDIVQKRRIKRKRAKAAQLRKRAKAAREYLSEQPDDLTAQQQKATVEAALRMEKEASEVEAVAEALEDQFEDEEEKEREEMEKNRDKD